MRYKMSEQVKRWKEKEISIFYPGNGSYSYMTLNDHEQWTKHAKDTTEFHDDNGNPIINFAPNAEELKGLGLRQFPTLKLLVGHLEREKSCE